MVKINGALTPVPADTPDWQVRDGLRALDQPALDGLGGAVGGDGKPLDPAFLGRHAQLMPLAPGGGRYALFLPGPGARRDPVMTRPDGQGPLVPFTIDLAVLEAARRRAAGFDAATGGAAGMAP